MSKLNIPNDVSFTNGQSLPQYYKAFTNFMKVQSIIHDGKPFARYYSDGNFETLTYSQIDHLATNLACNWAHLVENTDTISYLGEYGVNYLIVMLALLKLRATLMAISPRNSEAAIINLLEKTQCKVLIADIKYRAIAASASAQVLGGIDITFIKPLDIGTLVQEPLNPDYNILLNSEFSDEDIEKIAMIIHSSGSTGFPKPRYISNRYLLNSLNNFNYVFNTENNLNKLDENITLLSCAPLFHIFGISTLFTMATVGGAVVLLEKLPASQIDINNALTQNNCTAICATPIIYEEMITYLKKKNNFSTVQRLKIALYAGAPLQYESGEWLRTHGVNIRNSYGCTEIGPFMFANCHFDNKNWLSLGTCMKDANGCDYGVFETNDDSEPDIKHLYIRGDCPTLATGVSNRDDGGYDTNDLFKENPQCPGYYDYIGRRDDTLIMENGEKTNPVPMETTIRQSPMVKQVAVIGHARQCTAALIQIDMEYAIQFTPEEIISAVRDAVKEANKKCPSHSIILPQMIKIIPLNQTLPSTDKGTVKRKMVENDYQDVVDQLYKDILSGPAHSTINNSLDASTWSAEEVEGFLVEAVAEVLDLPKSTFKNRTQSIFDHGLNSLLSIQLRNRILEHFDEVPQNFLYQYSSISSMREALMSGNKEDDEEQMGNFYNRTQQLAEQYIRKAKKDFPVVTHDLYNYKPKVVLLTGVTGSLGSFMLRDLLLNKSVKKVYALVRGKEKDLMNRLVNAFESRALDSSLLKTDRIEVLPMRLNDPLLGFSREKYVDLKEQVTIVQHCAWLLDFNMTIDHFDKECIAPFYNLLKFTYNQVNPMRVHFISSISASASLGSNIIEESPLPFDSHVCMPMGYAQSKFVVETLFHYLNTEKNFPCYIERLGQVCGDSINGIWNMSEQYPLMFTGGGAIMHKMPALDTVIDWITVDCASSSIIDIMLRTADLPVERDGFVYHIVNPHIIQWNDVLEAMKNAGMTFDIVTPAEWVKELANDDTNPAYKLLGHYETNFKEAFKMPVWETKKTSAITPRIFESPIVDSNMFRKFLQYWKTA